MEQDGKIGSPHEELAFLKQRMAELESSISGGGKENAAGVRPETIRVALEQHLERAPEVLKKDYILPQAQVQTHATSVVAIKKDEEKGEEAHQRQISELFKIADEKGLWNAYKIVEQTKNPHLWDDFHDAAVVYIQNKHAKMI